MALDALPELHPFSEARPGGVPAPEVARLAHRLAAGLRPAAPVAAEAVAPREALRAAHAAAVAAADAAAFDAGEAWEIEDDGAPWLDPLGD